MPGWSEYLTNSYFRSCEDDQVVFFPFGPFKGYFVPRPAFQRVLITFLKRTTAFGLIIWIIATGIGALLGFGCVTFCAIGLIDLILFAVLIRRVTKRLRRLPISLSFAYYAQCSDVQSLWQMFLMSNFCVLFIFFFNHNLWSYFFVGGFGTVSLTTGLLLCLRYRKSD